MDIFTKVVLFFTILLITIAFFNAVVSDSIVVNPSYILKWQENLKSK